jgi:hypothetical protein
MKCPKCNCDMKLLGPSEMHHNPTDGKEYDRNNYNCPDCDVWVNVEVPKQK